MTAQFNASDHTGRLQRAGSATRHLPDPLPEFHYRVRWRSHGAHPGRHHSTQSGGGYEFYGHVPLLSCPDARNLDIHASLHDPFQQFVVRTFRQRSRIPVQMLADVSASMGFSGTGDKKALLATFAAACAYSAFRSGDPFGFIACDSEVRRDLSLPLRFHRGAALELWRRLQGFRPRGVNADALIDAPAYLGEKRCLLFLVSDFHFSLEKAADIFDRLALHDVVPVVLWDSGEFRALPRRGIARLSDPENGAERCLLMRPGLHLKFRQAFEQRRSDLVQVLSRHGREPFFLMDAFDPDRLTRYFLQG